MRLVFMGSPDFAVPSLNALADAHDIIAVYSQPPRAAGRGMTQKPTAVATVAMDRDIACHWPLSLKEPDIQAQLASHHADAFIVVAYGLLLPQAVLDIPRFGCINGHASLLPRWRGAAPIQRAIEAGDSQTGVCAMQMEIELDTGPVLHQRTTPITLEDTAKSLHDRLADLTAEILVETCEKIEAGIAEARPQTVAGTCYAEKIRNEEMILSPAEEAAILRRKIHAFSPFPGTVFMLADGSRLKLLTARLSEQNSKSPAGSFLGLGPSDGLMIATGNGLLEITQLQPAGKKPMQPKEFLNGRNWQIGQIIGEEL